MADMLACVVLSMLFILQFKENSVQWQFVRSKVSHDWHILNKTYNILFCCVHSNTHCFTVPLAASIVKHSHLLFSSIYFPSFKAFLPS